MAVQAGQIWETYQQGKKPRSKMVKFADGGMSASCVVCFTSHNKDYHVCACEFGTSISLKTSRKKEEGNQKHHTHSTHTNTHNIIKDPFHAF